MAVLLKSTFASFGATTMAELKRYYWDSTMWLGLINRETSKIAIIEHHYEAARAGYEEIFTSTIAYVEVFRLNSENMTPKPLPQEGLDIIAEALQQEFVKLIPVDMEIGISARRIRRQLDPIKGAGDPIHLASALRFNVDALYTHDHRHMICHNGLLMHPTGKPMLICEPDPSPPSLLSMMA